MRSFIVSVIGDLLTVSSLSAWRGQQIRQQLQGVEAWGKVGGEGATLDLLPRYWQLGR